MGCQERRNCPRANQRRGRRIRGLLLTRWQDDCHRRAQTENLRRQFKRIAQNNRSSLLADDGPQILSPKIDTATWTYRLGQFYFTNEPILATTSYSYTGQLWNTKTNQSIGTPLYHEDYVISMTFSADGKFLVTSCIDNHLYTWDVSAIIKEAGLPSDTASFNTFHC
ncbi:hypothetical protein BDR04DRAFT_315534 [Suillus decipiens]|nr:hypothetical protein BDR04DRAFT_315534 [Suillus decipiens]